MSRMRSSIALTQRLPALSDLLNLKILILNPGIVQGGSLAYICTQIMTIVDQEQSKVLWIPDGSL